ncbi:hypothetical protein, partial [Parasphingorhabdus sp.]|uniref:hypothetical protein n=1 Tax=Parasphingorhabdus sp. TaxID=2709688 RepID=UPI0030A3ED6F
MQDSNAARGRWEELACDRFAFAPGYSDTFFGGGQAFADKGSGGGAEVRLAQEGMGGDPRFVAA